MKDNKMHWIFIKYKHWYSQVEFDELQWIFETMIKVMCCRLENVYIELYGILPLLFTYY